MKNDNSIFLEDKNVSSQLDLALKNKDFSHAYLFVGPKGIGKYAQAKNFARAILCGGNKNDKSFCNLLYDYFHPDLIEVSSKESIKKEQIEELIEKAGTKPFESNKKIILIDGFDNVTIEGQNALLKTLEEPEDYLIIILVSSNIKNILPTIRSRARILKFQNISVERIYDYLLKTGLSEKNARLFSNLSCGSISLAKRYKEDVELLKKRDELIGILDNLIRTGSYYIFSYLDFFKENKENIEDILKFFSLWFRDLAFIKINKKEKIINIDKLNILELEDLTLDRILFIYNKILLTKENLSKNMNYDLSIEALLMYIGGM